MRGLRFTLVGLALLASAPQAQAAARHGRAPLQLEARSLDGAGNNRAHPAWGQAGTPYQRIAPARYADGAAAQAPGPSPRYVSNRIFNDLGQNLFSERGVSQWVWTWGQFMDHTFGLAQDGGESSPMAFDASDPLEAFRNDLGALSFTRDGAAPGTGTSSANPRQQINTVSSYIDGSSVYGDTPARLEWLREGPVDGSLKNNGPRLLMEPGGFLPRATHRGNAATAPTMAVDGQLLGHAQDRVVTGDVRANENIALTAVQTLFAREHNRIVAALPARMPGELKFQIARRVVGAEQQFITYNEFLPAVGVRLDPYRGYRPDVDATLGNEFATVAYRAHSMIHGEFELKGAAADYSPQRIARLQAMGVEVAPTTGDPSHLDLDVSLSTAFFQPDLVPALGLGTILGGLGAESQYNNDEQIDNALRSVLFQVPGPNAPDPAACFESPSAAGCYQGVVDLGALDLQRGRDHGMPTYNGLRRAAGLAPVRSFTQITGEPTESLNGLSIDDPAGLDFLALADRNGAPVALDSSERQDIAVRGLRRTTLAARLKAIYGTVDNVEAFVGLVSERHVRGTEFGPLQLALWTRQFRALRDGDRFFYANDPALEQIRRRYGIDYRHTLAQLIARDAGVLAGTLPARVFFAGSVPAPAGTPVGAGTGAAAPPHPPVAPGGGDRPVRKPNHGFLR